MNHFEKLTAQKITWLHYDKALLKEDREYLAKKFGIYEHHLTSTQRGKTPRPKISVNKKYVYFVFHLPYKPSNSSKLYICDLNVFLTTDTLITVESQGNVPALNNYFDTAKKSKRVLLRRFKLGTANLFLNLIKYLLNEVEETVDAQGEQVDLLNDEIFKTAEAQSFIQKISILRYNQIVASAALDRQSRVMEAYSGDKNPLKSRQDASMHKWSDISETFQTLAYELKADIEHLEGLVQTFETLVTHRTNETIKLLTIFSVVLMPLTLIAGIFGMNFKSLPMLTHPFGFLSSLVLMVTVLLGTLIVFKWRKWM